MVTPIRFGKAEAIRQIRALANQPLRTREDLTKWHAELASLYAAMKQHPYVANDMPHFIGHYFSDASIRMRDPEYAAMQARELEEALNEWWGKVTSNNALERSWGHRGRAVLAMDGVLAGAESAPCLAAQLSR